jgi:hypothetical protein
MLGWFSKKSGEMLGSIADSVSPLFRTNLDSLKEACNKVDEEYGSMMQRKDVDLGMQI